MAKLFNLFVVCALCVFSVRGEVVEKLPCEEGEAQNCEINEIRVVPCKEALKTPPKGCKLKKLKTATIEMDFTPNFEAHSLNNQFYWPNGLVDLPLAGMETDGCKSTKCPTVPGEKQSYSYNLTIDRYFPASNYDVKIVLKNTEDADKNKCCSIIKIKIVK